MSATSSIARIEEPGQNREHVKSTRLLWLFDGIVGQEIRSTESVSDGKTQRDTPNFSGITNHEMSTILFCLPAKHCILLDYMESYRTLEQRGCWISLATARTWTVYQSLGGNNPETCRLYYQCPKHGVTYLPGWVFAIGKITPVYMCIPANEVLTRDSETEQENSQDIIKHYQRTASRLGREPLLNKTPKLTPEVVPSYKFDVLPC